MSDVEQPSLAEQLAAIWARFREATLARVAELDDAVIALLENRLTDDARASAARESHKLAGSAGTFGFPGASVIARDLERLFRSTTLTAADVPALAEQLEQLRAELEGAPRPPATPSPAPSRSNRAFLLMVGDDAAVIEHLMIEGTGRGFDVVQAVRIREAEQLVRARRPDAVLIDLRHGGPETLRLLDALRAMTPAVPSVVVLHGSASYRRIDVASHGARRCLEASASPKDMIDAVDAEWRKSVEMRGTVLAADGDAPTLATLAELLRSRGLNAVVVDDASLFWPALEATNPDLLLLDAALPGIDRDEICGLVHGRPRFAGVPIVFLTTQSDAATAAAAFAAGADDYLPKPIDVAQLQVRVVHRLERLRALREHAETDGATGIRNRERSASSIDRFLELARSTKQPTTLSLVTMNADGLSPDAEVEVLRGLACAIATSLQPDEIVGRWDAREIVIASYGVTAHDVGNRLRATLADFGAHEFRSADGTVVRASARAGVAECPADGDDLAALEAAARAAALADSR
jgi:PleD family two-component response regulator